MLDGGPLLRHDEESLKGPFLSGCLFFFYNASLCALFHFLVLLNDFQLFIIQRKADSRRLWLNQCPPSVAWTSLLLSHNSVRFTFPSFYLLTFSYSTTLLYLCLSFQLSLANKSFVLERAASSIV